MNHFSNFLFRLNGFTGFKWLYLIAPIVIVNEQIILITNGEQPLRGH